MNPARPPVRVLMIDDSPLIRLGLRAALEDRADLTIVAEAGSGAEGIAAAAQHRPDVILLDLRLPDQPGFAVCREILKRNKTVRIIILTSATDERNVHEAISAGASGYLLKESDGPTLAEAILRVAAGHSVLDPTLADSVIRLMKQPPGTRAEARLASLSHQERRVLALLTDGLTNKEIGERLGLTEKTVKNYLSTVFDKLEVSRRAQAAAIFAQSNPE